jgi:predicted lipid-binding transport protein (Tim44 family)
VLLHSNTPKGPPQVVPVAAIPSLESSKPSASSPASPPGDSSTGDASNQSGGGINGALFGGVVGGVVAFVLIAAVAAFLISQATKTPPIPNSIELESPFEEPRYFTN